MNFIIHRVVIVQISPKSFFTNVGGVHPYRVACGTVIDKNWILTSATCCKRDDIVTIKFNDYSVFYAEDDEKEILSTLFHIHKDLDACLIRTAADMSEIVDKIPCLNKVLFIQLW